MSTNAPTCRLIRTMALTVPLLIVLATVAGLVPSVTTTPLASWGSGLTGVARAALSILSTWGPTAMGVALLPVIVAAWRRGERALVVGSVAGVAAALGMSDLIKSWVQEVRPCVTSGLDTVLACPGQGDWSWPSNHASAAAALAMAFLLLAPRLWPVMVAAAVVCAAARVLTGVHYMHDVLSGLALGVLVAGLIGLVVIVVQRRRAESAGPIATLPT